VTVLFREHDYLNVQRHYENRVREEIEAMPQKTLLMESPESLAEMLADKNTVHIPKLDRAGIYAEDKETKADARHYPDRFMVFSDERSLDVPATEITIHIPYQGDREVFKMQGNTYGSRLPSGTILDDKIVLRHVVVEHNSDKLRGEIERDITAIEQKLRELDNLFVGWRDKLRSIALTEMCKRIEKVRKDKSLVAGLGFPVKRREDAPETYRMPSIQKTLSPRAKAESGKIGSALPEPVLDFLEYKHIISVCRNMYRVIERSPTAFERMEEEHLRDHFLVQLNGQYQGQATGETFNFQGKTDILIRIDGKNIFIAECKFWKGESGFKETLNQLLNYASWRDSRLALIIFNRNTDFSSVLEKVMEAIKCHTQFVSTESENLADAEFTYKVRNTHDTNIIHYVTVLVFNVNVPKK
jgi:hypothetical protein